MDLATQTDRQVIVHRILDAIEDRLALSGAVEIRDVGEDGLLAPVVHRFTPGLYIREIFMPAGMLILSRIHKTEHPFVVSKGRARVFTENGWEEIAAPYTGITKPGTRRMLLLLEDTIWTTFHATALTDTAEIERSLLEPPRHTRREAA